MVAWAESVRRIHGCSRSLVVGLRPRNLCHFQVSLEGILKLAGSLVELGQPEAMRNVAGFIRAYPAHHLQSSVLEILVLADGERLRIKIAGLPAKSLQPVEASQPQQGVDV